MLGMITTLAFFLLSQTALGNCFLFSEEILPRPANLDSVQAKYNHPSHIGQRWSPVEEGVTMWISIINTPQNRARYRTTIVVSNLRHGRNGLTLSGQLPDGATDILQGDLRVETAYLHQSSWDWRTGSWVDRTAEGQQRNHLQSGTFGRIQVGNTIFHHFEKNGVTHPFSRWLPAFSPPDTHQYLDSEGAVFNWRALPKVALPNGTSFNNGVFVATSVQKFGMRAVKIEHYYVDGIGRVMQKTYEQETDGSFPDQPYSVHYLENSAE